MGKCSIVQRSMMAGMARKSSEGSTSTVSWRSLRAGKPSQASHMR